MPNTGRPSRDCHECRRRRVKVSCTDKRRWLQTKTLQCDLVRPECQRCTRIGKRCPGYRDETSVLFRNEDMSSFAGPSANRDRRRSKTDEGSEIEHSESTTPQLLLGPNQSMGQFNFQYMNSMVMQHGWHSPPLRTLPEQWSQHAVPLVLCMLSAQRPDGLRYLGKAEFLPEMLSRQVEGAPLILCCKALGMAFLANKLGTSPS